MNLKKDKISNKIILEALDNCMGYLSPAAKKLSISRNTLAAWINEDEELKQGKFNIEEEKLDYSESQLLKNIREGKEASIFFHLKCKGKKRGYVERQELTGADGTPIMNTNNAEEKTDEELMAIVNGRVNI